MVVWENLERCRMLVFLLAALKSLAPADPLSAVDLTCARCPDDNRSCVYIGLTKLSAAVTWPDLV